MQIKREQLEVLAPVGGAAQLEAAVRAGADAVYLGTSSFNARQNAENFDDLSRVVGYCHARNVRVHVTVNTLVMDREMEELEKTAEMITQSGADAVIIQDLAVMRLFRDCCPSIERHASTQMAVHNAEGAMLLQDLGFDRIVLARELSLREIERITSRISIDTESFVHGAICMSLSGGCYMSSMIGGRSGNRGYCAQPCRLNFECDGQEYALSLKDLSYISHLQELADAGVSSLKIEGRMKRPEYVAASVDACVRAKLGKPYDAAMLEAVFSRSGFTDGFLTGKIDREMFGIRTKEDVEQTRNVIQKIHELYRRERQRVPVEAVCTITEDRLLLTLSDRQREVTVEEAGVQEAKTRPTDEERIRDAIGKLGNTPFTLAGCRVRGRNDRYVPASVLNDARRQAAQQLLEARQEPKPHPFVPEKKTYDVPYSCGNTALWMRFAKRNGIPKQAQTAEKLILPLDEITSELIDRFGERLIGELPSICFPSYEEELQEKIKKLKQNGLTQVMANNLYGIRLAIENAMQVHTGWGLNVTNTRAVRELEKMGCASFLVSFELNMEDIGKLGGDLERGTVIYGYLPLMRMRACPGKKAGGCRNCGGERVLTDRTGRVFRLACETKRYSVLYNSVPLYIADRKREKTDYELLYFTSETAEDAASVIESVQREETPVFERTTGLYYRKLL